MGNATINSEYIEVLKSKDFLRGREVEALYGISNSTLKRWRMQKAGPQYMQQGNGKGSTVFYSHDAIKEFMVLNIK